MDRFRQHTAEQTVCAIVEDLIQDWGLELEAPVGATTLLVADLDFTSVDVIQLCVALEQSYERKLGFQDLLMRDGSYVGDLTLAEVAAHVEARLQQPPQDPS
jgi:acyl carrier protein